jgi:hypothetical protein
MNGNTLNEVAKVIQMGTFVVLGFMAGYIKGVFDVMKEHRKRAVKRDKTGAIIMKMGADRIYRAK